MLALSRKKNEALVINNNVEITVLEIKGEQVKLGISAPREVPVYRKEVYMQIQDANKEAGDVDGMEALKNLLGWICREEIACLQRRTPITAFFLVPGVLSEFWSFAQGGAARYGILPRSRIRGWRFPPAPPRGWGSNVFSLLTPSWTHRFPDPFRSRNIPKFPPDSWWSENHRSPGRPRCAAKALFRWDAWWCSDWSGLRGRLSASRSGCSRRRGSLPLAVKKHRFWYRDSRGNVRRETLTCAVFPRRPVSCRYTGGRSDSGTYPYRSRRFCRNRDRRLRSHGSPLRSGFRGSGYSRRLPSGPLSARPQIHGYGRIAPVCHTCIFPCTGNLRKPHPRRNGQNPPRSCRAQSSPSDLRWWQEADNRCRTDLWGRKIHIGPCRTKRPGYRNFSGH